MGNVLRKFAPPSVGKLVGVSPDSTAGMLFEPYGALRRNVTSGGPITPHDIFDPVGAVKPTSAQATASKAKIMAPVLAADQDLVYKRQRQRASALSTGAGPSGSSPVTSAMAYGKPTLGG